MTTLSDADRARFLDGVTTAPMRCSSRSTRGQHPYRHPFSVQKSPSPTKVESSKWPLPSDDADTSSNSDSDAVEHDTCFVRFPPARLSLPVAPEQGIFPAVVSRYFVEKRDHNVSDPSIPSEPLEDVVSPRPPKRGRSSDQWIMDQYLNSSSEQDFILSSLRSLTPLPDDAIPSAPAGAVDPVRLGHVRKRPRLWYRVTTASSAETTLHLVRSTKGYLPYCKYVQQKRDELENELWKQVLEKRERDAKNEYDKVYFSKNNPDGGKKSLTGYTPVPTNRRFGASLLAQEQEGPGKPQPVELRHNAKFRRRPSAGLYVKKSTVPGAGHGLFCSLDIQKGEVISEYDGLLLTDDQYDERYPNNDAQYVIAVGEGLSVDGDDPAATSLAKFANHQPAGKANAGYMQSGCRIFVVAFKQIKADTEIFTDYGRQFWVSSQEHGELPRRFNIKK